MAFLASMGAALLEKLVMKLLNFGWSKGAIMVAINRHEKRNEEMTDQIDDAITDEDFDNASKTISNNTNHPLG